MLHLPTCSLFILLTTKCILNNFILNLLISFKTPWRDPIDICRDPMGSKHVQRTTFSFSSTCTVSKYTLTILLHRCAKINKEIKTGSMHNKCFHREVYILMLNERMDFEMNPICWADSCLNQLKSQFCWYIYFRTSCE